MDFAHKANKAIECNVVSCRNHCDSQDYCSLDHVRIGTHECHPSMDQCTDCLSFIQTAGRETGRFSAASKL